MQLLPFTLLTNLFVIVAVLEIKLKKLRATLSLFKIDLAFPYTVATVFPLFIFFPSLIVDLNIIFLSEYLKDSFAIFKPPITQFCSAIILALIILFFVISLVVTSPEGLKSSLIACVTIFITFDDQRPIAVIFSTDNFAFFNKLFGILISLVSFSKQSNIFGNVIFFM